MRKLKKITEEKLKEIEKRENGKDWGLSPVFLKLIRMLVNHNIGEAMIRSVINFLETEENFKKMTCWLENVNNPTKNDIMLKAYLISDEE